MGFKPRPSRTAFSLFLTSLLTLSRYHFEFSLCLGSKQLVSHIHSQSIELLISLCRLFAVDYGKILA
jgi:hypothetical protein